MDVIGNIIKDVISASICGTLKWIESDDLIVTNAVGEEIKDVELSIKEGAKNKVMQYIQKELKAKGINIILSEEYGNP
jgi:methylmalonyl-CoA mutase cobalamin-binding subunit